jgi:hypothetical protein
MFNCLCRRKKEKVNYISASCGFPSCCDSGDFMFGLGLFYKKETEDKDTHIRICT